MAEAARRPVVAVGQKAYLSYAATVSWLAAAGAPAREASDRVDVVVFPVAPALPAAVALGAGAYQVGAQDVSDRPAGAFTGELPAALLAELGVAWVEIGHAERRYLFGETPELVGRKITAAVEHGLSPLVCVGEGRLGETDPVPAAVAIQEAGVQLADALAWLPANSPFLVAYEPVWAIGADRPADVEHIRTVAAGLRERLSGHPAARLVYGGTAGPGLYAELRDAADGLFLGRRAHDPTAFAAVLAEVAGEGH